MYALVDCNNFYASCERAFNPKLMGKPVVVLSSNDGCVIARSQEAKKLDIPMAAPAYKLENLFIQHSVHVFSANFTLYGDMSRRVMRILSTYTSDIEIYSIDEAFLAFKNKAATSLTDYANELRNIVNQWTGIPISIGIAPTKTLAKICNHIAKKEDGVFAWPSGHLRDKVLELTPVESIWGVGYRSAPKLNSFGIYTALDLKKANEHWIRSTFGVNMLRTITELKEVSCSGLTTQVEPRKGIISSRSFGRSVGTLEELEEAVSTYTSRACEKLRDQDSIASHIYVTIVTSKNNGDYPKYQYSWAGRRLGTASSYTPDFIAAAFDALHELYRKGYRYKKAAITLSGIVPENQVQLNMFQADYPFAKTKNVMQAMDSLNDYYGREVVKYAATGLKQPWRSKREKMSQRYTTNWDELLIIRN